MEDSREYSKDALVTESIIAWHQDFVARTHCRLAERPHRDRAKQPPIIFKCLLLFEAPAALQQRDTNRRDVCG